jgi:uncharacterized membrane protein
MILADYSLGAPSWLPWASAMLGLGVVVLIWSYLRSGGPLWLRICALLLKTVGLVLLAACLVEPLYTGERPRPGANLMIVIADNSRSMQLADGKGDPTRGETTSKRLLPSAPWLSRLGQDFDVRQYSFDSTLRPISDGNELKFDGESSSLAEALRSVGQRFRGQPVAGIIVLTDGAATDWSETGVSLAGMPPIYPVAMGKDSGHVDLSVTRVGVSQTNFEAAPVTLMAEFSSSGLEGKDVVVQVKDDVDKEVARRTVKVDSKGQIPAQRFLVKPERPGVCFFSVKASLSGEEKLEIESSLSTESTLRNNIRFATVDRGGGPYRILYVGGRPNWEFKFFKRGLMEDPEVQLSGLVRIARKEPKFTFKSRDTERTNPLYRGYGDNKLDETEQYNEAVLVRINPEGDELRGGFPKDVEDLFSYHAIILDDIEAGFFTHDQLSLLQQFVSRRGGGFLMLAGKDSFGSGGYSRTPVGEMLPIYLDRSQTIPPETGYRLALTREGWLQPWLRVRDEESAEQKRLAEMPNFHALNSASSIKPGASVLAQVTDGQGNALPALVVQPFGRGRASALLIGDLWRWSLKRPDPQQNDLEKSWRQTVRWLISDVPKAVDAEISSSDATGQERMIVVSARDKKYEPLDNAQVTLKVRTPDNRTLDLTAESSTTKPGQYVATFSSRIPGKYSATAHVKSADASEVGLREIGWTVEPDTEEFRTLATNRVLLERIAKDTGGEVLRPNGLESFVSSLPNRKIPIKETWTHPIWHRSELFLAALLCLVGEWALRRWKGMP